MYVLSFCNFVFILSVIFGWFWFPFQAFAHQGCAKWRTCGEQSAKSEKGSFGYQIIISLSLVLDPLGKLQLQLLASR